MRKGVVVVNRTPTAAELAAWYFPTTDVGESVWDEGDSFLVLDSVEGATVHLSLWAYPFPPNQPPVKIQHYQLRITKARG
jgi:hypothetical protein